MKTIIKWPGGKTREINEIKNLIPEYERYVEPFFGGGAIFFNLEPKKAEINDISNLLIDFYQLIKEQNSDLKNYLLDYAENFNEIKKIINYYYSDVIISYRSQNKESIEKIVKTILKKLNKSNKIVLDKTEYEKIILKNVLEKFKRTYKNNQKKEFDLEDLKQNLITGFTSGFYMYFRNIYNKIALNKIEVDKAYKIANFYFIREYCYGSMFRYNKLGEFNIPYGGVSYNKKNFIKKINNIFNPKIETLFQNTNIHNLDFEFFLEKITLKNTDFIFLDPPYDTDFSDYDNRSFTLDDQKRLAEYLKKTKAMFILIIKNTDFIYNLYKDNFKILTFKKIYSYNVKSRNKRNVEHLIITNL